VTAPGVWKKQLRIVRFDPFEPLPPCRQLVRGARWKDGSEVIAFRAAGGGALEVKLYRPDWPEVPEAALIPWMFLSEALAEGIEWERDEPIPLEGL
jgi:hypothetical protein